MKVQKVPGKIAYCDFRVNIAHPLNKNIIADTIRTAALGYVSANINAQVGIEDVIVRSSADDYQNIGSANDIPSVIEK